MRRAVVTDSFFLYKFGGFRFFAEFQVKGKLCKSLLQISGKVIFADRTGVLEAILLPD